MSVEKFKRQSDDEILNQMFQNHWKEKLSSMYKKFCFDLLDDLHKIKENWRLIVGDDDLCEFTEPVSFEDGVLSVKIIYSTARSEFLAKKELIELNLKIVVPSVDVKKINITRR